MPKRLSSVCLLWPLFAPASVSALVVEIQGIRLESAIPGYSCVEIAGNYQSVQILPSENGKTPRICHNNSNKINSITILNSTFVSQAPANKDIVLKIQHEFPAGLNGKVMSRAKLQGFFSTSSGVGVPSGDQLSYAATFSQTGHDDGIAEAFNYKVGEDLDSAIFEYSVKKQYLISGPRGLKGTIKILFTDKGHKLTLVEKSGIFIDTGSTMADKIETMEPAPSTEEEQGEEPVEKKPTPTPEVPKKGLPNPVIPFPNPSDNGSLPPTH